MHIFVHTRISYGHVMQYMHMHAAIFVYVHVAETAPEFVKHNSNVFVFDCKHFSELVIVREHKHV